MDACVHDDSCRCISGSKRIGFATDSRSPMMKRMKRRPCATDVAMGKTDVDHRLDFGGFFFDPKLNLPPATQTGKD